ncbi:MAG: 4'-phosphopantetheinyl transferase superfamily protein [Hyphomicrobiales bacterium]|nr:4'-phosphopantetheinyl transferase superfamily protein [Hyphomicrobiales bacterium]
MDLSLPDVQRLAGTLSHDERKRAAQFRFELHRYRFVVRRGILRTLLGRYLDISPNHVPLKVNPEGKLVLTPQGFGCESIEFNLAHSQGVAVFAFVCNQRIGIDIERVYPVPEAKAISQGYFAREEREALDRLTGDQYWRAFYSCWTRKEAYLKAEGQGLLQGLDRGIVFGGPAHRHLPLSRQRRTAVETQWTLLDFIPAPGYQATLAMSETPKAVHYWRLDPSWYAQAQVQNLQI